jgi:HEAT repeat protein
MRRLFLSLLALGFVSSPVHADAADETALKGVGLPVDGSGLLEFVKQRARPAIPADELTPFAKDLGSADPTVATKAAAGFVMRGPLAVPTLRRVVNDLADKGAAERARKCLAAIEGRGGIDIATAVVRLIGVRRPAGTVEALLDYLPFADDTPVLDAIGTTLGQLAYAEGQAHPALVKAIESDVPVLRATAAEALTRLDRPETRPAIAKRLTDPSRPVRQRTALALARVEDVNAIPVLIDLMGDLSKAERPAVEETLRSIAGETVPKSLPTGDDEKDRKALREAWAGWWRKVDGPALVDEFRGRTLAPSEEAKAVQLVQALGDRDYRVREKASATLVAMGAKVLSHLRPASKDADGERARRADDAITKINQSDAKRVPIGTARLIALRRPELAVGAMLAYLPYADEDDGMIAEVRAALTSLALDPNGKPDPALVAALGDKEPIRRSVAAEALCRGGGQSSRADVKKLLTDSDLMVRQTAAAALALSGEKEAVPVLIELLGELSGAQAWTAQDLLLQLAGDKAPPGLAGDKPEDRKKYRDAWAAWWKSNSQSVDLVKLTSSPGYLGYTLLIEVGGNSNGRVSEVTRDGKVRWVVGNLRYPVDAIVLPGERVLVTEWDGQRVAEWDFKGNLIWKKDSFNGRPTNAQRLPSGNTFICTTNELMEVDKGGKTVYQINVPAGLTAGYRSANGEIVCLRNDGQCVRYDTAGKELKTFPSNRDTSWTSGMDLARNGNILITQPSPNMKVSEFSVDGKLVREWGTPNVTTATKVGNGNVLAASHNDKKVVEYDPSGKKVWEFGGPSHEYHIFRARRR